MVMQTHSPSTWEEEVEGAEVQNRDALQGDAPKSEDKTRLQCAKYLIASIA